MHQQVRFNQSMIVEREEGMKEIETAVTEINDIFRDLALAVQDQGQMLGADIILYILPLSVIFHSAAIVFVRISCLLYLYTPSLVFSTG